MTVAIDFDGTIADTNSEKASWIRRTLAITVIPHLCDRTSCMRIIGENEYERMSKHVYSQETTLHLPPVTGALEAICQLQEKRRVVIVTARTGTILESASLWLSRHAETKALKLVGVSTSHTSKAEVCQGEGAKVLVDDDERHLYHASALGIFPILFKYLAPEEFEHGETKICRSWEEILTCLENV